MTKTAHSAHSDRDLIATPHELASRAGRDVLDEGGSAVDACIAANAVLTVVAPDQTAIGGDCFLIVHDGADGSVTGLNGSGRAPRAADADALLADGWSGMPARGILAVTVPGTVDAWHAAHARWGRIEMARLLAPAIRLAREGFPVSRTLALSFQETLAPREPWTGVAPAPPG
jgi:gamma-glutamyltranspeptidase/glutathione hydrolase